MSACLPAAHSKNATKCHTDYDGLQDYFTGTYVFDKIMNVKGVDLKEKYERQTGRVAKYRERFSRMMKSRRRDITTQQGPLKNEDTGKQWHPGKLISFTIL